MSDIEELDAIDEEFERLEEIRRHGVASINEGNDRDSNEENDEDPYYTLPPSRVEMMQHWQEWRVVINDLMIDTGLNKDEVDTKRDMDILTSSGFAKTPDFFLGKNSIHGNRVKDEYGGEAITEADDSETKVAKKIMEENFYIFGIPRIAVRRFSEDSGMNGSRRSSVATSPTSPTSSTSDINTILPVQEQRRGSFKSSTDFGFSSNGPKSTLNVLQTYTLDSEPKKPKLNFLQKKFLKPSKGPQLPPRRRFSTGNINM